MTDIKMNLQLGALRLEYEGTSEFAERELLELVSRFAAIEVPHIVQVESSNPSKSEPSVAIEVPARAKLSTTDFAVKAGAKSGTDLVMAAAAYLHHTRGMEEFRRSDILMEMKTAKAFFKASFGSNLSKSLDILIKSGRLQNPKADTFTLPYSELAKIETLL